MYMRAECVHEVGYLGEFCTKETVLSGYTKDWVKMNVQRVHMQSTLWKQSVME